MVAHVHNIHIQNTQHIPASISAVCVGRTGKGVSFLIYFGCGKRHGKSLHCFFFFFLWLKERSYLVIICFINRITCLSHFLITLCVSWSLWCNRTYRHVKLFSTISVRCVCFVYLCALLLHTKLMTLLFELKLWTTMNKKHRKRNYYCFTTSGVCVCVSESECICVCVCVWFLFDCHCHLYLLSDLSPTFHFINSTRQKANSH